MPRLARVADGGLRQLGGRAEHAWSRLSFERRLAAGAAFGLLLSLFLPWFQETVLSAKVAIPVSATISGWGAFSLFEAVVLVVAVGTLVLLFQRAEGRTFPVPGGDGGQPAVGRRRRLGPRRAPDVRQGDAVGLRAGHHHRRGRLGHLRRPGAAVLLAYAGWRLRRGRPPSDPLRVPDPPEVRAAATGRRAHRRRAASSWRSRSITTPEGSVDEFGDLRVSHHDRSTPHHRRRLRLRPRAGLRRHDRLLRRDARAAVRQAVGQPRRHGVPGREPDAGDHAYRGLRRRRSRRTRCRSHCRSPTWPRAREQLEAKGVRFVTETFDSGVCWQAICLDPDGNPISLHHRYAPRDAGPAGT